MRTIILVLVAVVAVVGLPERAAAVSEAVAPWLMFPMGARASGMGGAQVTEAQGAEGVYWNPANLGFYLDGMSGTLMHFYAVPDLTDDVYFDYLSYAKQVEGLGGLGFNVMLMNYGESTATDEAGLELLTFGSWDAAVGAGWGTRVSERFSVGVGAKIITSHLAPEINDLEEGKGTTWALDFGVHGRQILPYWGLRWGLSIQNLGPSLKFVDSSSPNPLPLNFRSGFAFDPWVDDLVRVTVAADMNKILVRQKEIGDGSTSEVELDPAYKALFTAWTDESLGDEIQDAIYNFGVEAALIDMVFLRLGRVQDHTGDIRDFTFGGGVLYQGLHVDFALYPQATGLDHVKRFSVTYDFPNFR